MAEIYSISEMALRTLPRCVPGNPSIFITNCQGELIGPDDPTPSTFLFTRSDMKIIWQCAASNPIQSTRPDRTVYFWWLEQRRPWYALAAKRFSSIIKSYLHHLGGAATGREMSEIIEICK
ncbi:hypothetical protein [Prosthecobacter sp.]|uniref:hypothetical protein n=1 Tax=Prosthecobacter sp. TaxID=1965333 RepID=UPI002AC8D13F|nr:hypothetical protein [Prosthecobacter sp.]